MGQPAARALARKPIAATAFHILMMIPLLPGTGCGMLKSEPRPEPVQTPPGMLPPQEVSTAVDALSDSIMQQVKLLAAQMEQRIPSNDMKRLSLRWRLRTAEVATKASQRRNALAALIELWYQTLAMRTFYAEGEGADWFGPHQHVVIEALDELTSQAEFTVSKAVPRDRFPELKQEILGAVRRGGPWLAPQSDQERFAQEVLSSENLQDTLQVSSESYGLFDSVARASDAAASLALSADRAVEQFEYLPEILRWQAQMLSLELQQQPGVADLLVDVSRAVDIMQQMQQTAESLPRNMRKETVALLNESESARQHVRQTLAQTEELVKSVDTLVRSTQRLVQQMTDAGLIGDEEETPATAEAQDDAGEPQEASDIQDYTTALQAAERTIEELNRTIVNVQQVLDSPTVTDRIALASKTMRGLINLVAFYVMLTFVLLAALIVTIIWAARHIGRTSTTSAPPPDGT